jgi:hypothetical protein
MAEFKKLTFDALTVREEFVSHTHLITPEAVDTSAYAVDDHQPWFFGPSPFGGPVTYRTLTANQALHLRHGAYIVHAGPHASMEFNFLQPIVIGMRVRSRGSVIDKHWRRGKPHRTARGGRPMRTRALDLEGELARRGIPSRRRSTSARPHDV